MVKVARSLSLKSGWCTHQLWQASRAGTQTKQGAIAALHSSDFYMNLLVSHGTYPKLAVCGILYQTLSQSGHRVTQMLCLYISTLQQIHVQVCAVQETAEERKEKSIR